MPSDLPDDVEPDDMSGGAGPEGTGFGPHPHPDDRLWRHPSEAAARGAGGGSTPGTSPGVSGPGGSGPSGSGPARRNLRSGRSVLLPLALIALVLGSGITMVALSAFGAFDPPPARVVIEKIETATDANLSTTAIVDRIRPTVVRIETTRAGVMTAGTGVIYRSDGYVLTTADAVSGADSVVVITTDGHSTPASVVGLDPTDDIAVLRIDLPDVQSAVLGHPDALVPGDPVLALSLDESVTDPITSSETIADNSRRVDAIGGSTLHDMIAAQDTTTTFDDAVLCSDSGAILGIFTTRPADPTATANGGTDLAHTRFATPIDYAVRVADSIVRTGSARLPWLGVMSDDLDSGTTARLGRSGTVLTEVSGASPAEAADLRVGDIIVSVDGSPVTSATSLVMTLRRHEIGDSISITYIRDGVQKVTTTVLGDRP